MQNVLYSSYGLTKIVGRALIFLLLGLSLSLTSVSLDANDKLLHSSKKKRVHVFHMISDVENKQIRNGVESNHFIGSCGYKCAYFFDFSQS